jgi:hypothetical protein
MSCTSAIPDSLFTTETQEKQKDFSVTLCLRGEFESGLL